MYLRTSARTGRSSPLYLHDGSLAGLADRGLGKPSDACLMDLVCVPHQHVARTCGDGRSFTSAATPTTMTRSAMNPGFFRPADGFHEFDIELHAKVQNLLTEKYPVMLSAESRRTGTAHADDRVRVAVVDLTGDKICKPGYADWGSTIPITSGSTVKTSMLYAAHQLLFDLNEMARTHGLRTVAELKNKADEVWARLRCPPDLDWLVQFDTKGPTVRVSASRNLAIHLTLMVDAQHSNSSVGSANELILRLGFGYIASLLWQSGLRRTRSQGLWVRNTYLQKAFPARLRGDCHERVKEKSDGKDVERLIWAQDATDDPGFRLTALSVVTFFTLLAQRRLVNESASIAMEALLRTGCTYPLNQFAAIPGMKIRASKCGLTSEVMHVAMLREATSGKFRYALAALVQNHNRSKAVESFLHSFVRDIDRLVGANNP